MKKIAIVALAAAATFITSCDIERMPYDKYTEDKIMEDKDAAVDVLLNGCYAKLKTIIFAFIPQVYLRVITGKIQIRCQLNN